MYPVVLIKFASATILRVCPTPLIQLLHITPKLRLHGGIIPTPLPSYNPSWLMTSPAVIQLAPRGSWTGRISPAAVARSVGSLPHWAKGLGGSPGARGQGGFEACCSMERVGKWFMKGWKTAKFTSTKEYYTGTAPDVKAVLSWMDTYKGWDGMG